MLSALYLILFLETMEALLLGVDVSITCHTKWFVFLKNRRAVQKNMVYIDEQRVMMKYLFPLNEVVVDFYDLLKSLSSGYAR